MVQEAIAFLAEYNDPANCQLIGYLAYGKTQAIADFSVGNVSVKEGDTCFVVHATKPDVATFNLDYFLRRVRLEFKIIGREVREEDLSNTHVLGFTKPQIAKLAPRFGFSVYPVEVPPAYKENIEAWERDIRIARGRRNLNKPVDMILFCHQSGENFVRRFQD